ncbi:MAG: TlpA disulfide reductase family protein [Rubrivivax sp.]|nr:TlpA disulfide reductase family protein [Rubrivivax sp.]
MAISLGPLALPLAPLLLLVAVLAAQWLAARLARRPRAGDGEAPEGPAQRGTRAGDSFTTATLLGLLAARGVYVALHAGAYFAAPWSLIDVRDGGWHAGAGLAAGFGWLAWRASQWPAVRPALATGATAGALLWFGLHAALAPSRGATMPAVEVTALGSAGTRPLPQAAQGRPAVVVLWASWCAPCREEMPLLAAAQAQETGLHFLFVNQGENEATVRRYLASLPYPVQNVLLDAHSALGPAVGSPGLPTTLFYDATGRQVDAHFGVLNAAALASRLDALRPAPPPRAPR